MKPHIALFFVRQDGLNLASSHGHKNKSYLISEASYLTFGHLNPSLKYGKFWRGPRDERKFDVLRWKPTRINGDEDRMKVRQRRVEVEARH